jgi:cytochrome c553
VEQGNAEQGRKIAETCDSCHAATPQNASSDFPYLQGQLATYLYKQLQDYKHGKRPHDIMKAIVAGLSDQDMANVARWYSLQSRPERTPSTMNRETVMNLVERGDGRRILPPCSACHGNDGQGKMIDNPSLAGQKAVYLENALLAYQSGTRYNDLYQRMRLIAQQLSQDEIKLLAKYYQGM